MQLTDTHSHLYAHQFKEDLEATIERSFREGVDRIFLPNIDLDSIGEMLRLEEQYPNNCFPMMGLHPCSVKDDYRSVLDQMRAWFDQHSFVAVGEIGIDLYWDKSTLNLQEEAFRTQIEWAKELDLPIVIHARESFNEIFKILDEVNDDRLRGIFHCFTGTTEQAEKIIDYGDFWLGLGGVLTFKKSGLDQAIKHIDLKHIVLETDAPYLAPTPYRGKRNESSYVKLVAAKLAEIKALTLEEVAKVTTANSQIIFRR